MLGGPSELVVVANRVSNPDYVVADMEAQAEHLGGLSILVSTSKALMKKVKAKVPTGFMIYAKDLDEAAEIVNEIAPEHLQILLNKPNEVLKNIRHAGAIFLGPYSPTALGDYAAGPSHVLPTMGSAKFFSGLSVSDFRKKSHVISYSKKALEKVAGAIDKIATLEGLPRHAESIKVRFKNQ
jgi:histidinol dehydrogenase